MSSKIKISIYSPGDDLSKIIPVNIMQNGGADLSEIASLKLIDNALTKTPVVFVGTSFCRELLLYKVEQIYYLLQRHYANSNPRLEIEYRIEEDADASFASSRDKSGYAVLPPYLRVLSNEVSKPDNYIEPDIYVDTEDNSLVYRIHAPEWPVSNTRMIYRLSKKLLPPILISYLQLMMRESSPSWNNVGGINTRTRIENITRTLKSYDSSLGIFSRMTINDMLYLDAHKYVRYGNLVFGTRNYVNVPPFNGPETYVQQLLTEGYIRQVIRVLGDMNLTAAVRRIDTVYPSLADRIILSELKLKEILGENQ